MTSAWDLSAGLPAVGEAVLAMEARGVLLDVEACRRGEARAAADEQAALETLRGLSAGLGLEDPDAVWTSPVQLQRLLHCQLGLPPAEYWKKGRVRVERGEVKLDATALAYLAGHHPDHRELLTAILRRRKIWSGLKYLRKLPGYVAPDGYIHPVFGSAGDRDERAGAVTGRRACKNPELHQIPADDEYNIRECFIAGEGRKLVVVDQKALEVVLLADLIHRLFGDDQLLEMASPGAPDIHSRNAVMVFRDVLGYRAEFTPEHFDGLTPEEWLRVPGRPDGFKKHPSKFVKWARNMIKAIWYGLQYGKGGYGFGSTLFDMEGNPLGEQRAQAMVDGILAAIPGLKRYQDWVMETILEHGGISTLGGRWCDLRDLVRGDKWMLARAWRRALNFPMQGSGADLMGEWLVALENDARLVRWGWGTVKEVHDEVVLRGPEESAEEACEIVKYHALNVFPLSLARQVSGGVSDNWSDGKHE